MIERYLMPIWALLTLLLALVAGGQAAQQPDCESLGFTGLSLCSDCRELSTFVKDDGLVEECLRCCAQESTKEVTKFSSAVLEICPQSLRSFPHIEGFVNNKVERWPNLKVRMKYGAAPRLILKNKGGPSSTVRIDQWKTHDIEHYLSEKLSAARQESE